jgi:hypothetical protein
MKKTKKKTTSKNSIEINGRLIPWSFVWRVHSLCGGDWDSTIDCFWKARHCTGENGIQRYIMSGLKGKAYGDKWMLHPSRMRCDGLMGTLRDWWMGLYERRTGPGKDGVDIGEMIAALTGKFGMNEVLGRQKGAV